MPEKNASRDVSAASISRVWRTTGLLLLGLIAGSAMVLAFLAYGQPELLLEQLNLRYCG